jgi:hypothetical protein
MSLSSRKLNELNQKLESLTNEFAYWREKSKEEGPLQKHNSQIHRVTLQLEGLKAGIGKELDDLSKSDDAKVLSQVREVERDILEVHRIWEFFRSKFVLRGVEWFSPYLVAADELAASAYSAAQENYDYQKVSKEALKAPPLVFFNGGSSPYTMPQSMSYKAEAVAGEELQNVESWELLKSLPIPVIGIPWFQIQHLPDILVIAHEVGHDVEQDFQLTGTISDLLEAAMEAAKFEDDHRKAWRAWLRESFADLFGNLVAGPAFVESLLDFLATDRTSTEQDQRKGPKWGIYPPDYLRVLVNLKALELQNFKLESARLSQDLKNTYGTHAMTSFVPDIEHVVRAIIDGVYPEFKNKTLREIIGFSKSDQDAAVKDSERLLLGNAPSSTNIRSLLAAARLGYTTNPQVYKEKKAHNLILTAVPGTQKGGVRAEGRKKLTDQEKAAADQFDKSAGEQLFQKLKRRKRKS